MKDFINQIYLETLFEVLKNIPEQYREEIEKNYKNSLYEKYYNVVFEEENREKVINYFVNTEISFWKNMNSNLKLSYLIKDVALEKIEYISNLGYKCAKERLDNNILINELEANSYINLMNEHLANVKPFNIVLAQNYISEGIMDFMYACGKTDNKSLRFARYK